MISPISYQICNEFDYILSELGFVRGSEEVLFHPQTGYLEITAEVDSAARQRTNAEFYDGLEIIEMKAGQVSEFGLSPELLKTRQFMATTDGFLVWHVSTSAGGAWFRETLPEAIAYCLSHWKQARLGGRCM